MVSLAEPKNRNRNRYNLTPRGKPLFDDETRFGTKMLEKMGWSKGKGLGANEDGSAEFVRVRYKHDAEGLGYEARDDQWTQHEQSFNGLLQTLNGNSNDEAAVSRSADEQSDVEMRTVGFGFAQTKTTKKPKLKATISGQSLEEQSKKSRARVHYKKFTRGKDLAQYSEKDLANIFGKKSLDAAAPETLMQNITNNEQSTEVEERTENFHCSNLSVDAYFKQKLNSLKKTKNSCEAENLAANVKETEKLKKGNKRVAHSMEEAVTEIKKKKKNKQKNKEETNMHSMEVATAVIEKKKKKKNKQKIEKVKENTKNNKTLEELEEELLKEVKRLKKKKKKSSMESVATEEKVLVQEIPENNVAIADEVAPKTKKSKKQKNKTTVIMEENTNVENIEEHEKTNTTETQSKEEKVLLTKNLENTSEQAEKSIYAQYPNMPDKYPWRATLPKTRMSIEEIHKMYESYNVYEINEYTAELFRFLDLDAFKGSNINDIKGYGFDDKTQIKIVKCATDEENIHNLWASTITKQAMPRSVNTYTDYQKQVSDARKRNEKPPRFKTHQYKRKDAFKIINI